MLEQQNNGKNVDRDNNLDRVGIQVDVVQSLPEPDSSDEKDEWVEDRHHHLQTHTYN